jgi:hypothetical protein
MAMRKQLPGPPLLVLGAGSLIARPAPASRGLEPSLRPSLARRQARRGVGIHSKDLHVPPGLCKDRNPNRS